VAQMRVRAWWCEVCAVVHAANGMAIGTVCGRGEVQREAVGQVEQKVGRATW